MMTLCRTGRGRIACGLGGLTIAVLALACLWALSPAVTAGDDLPAKKDAKLPDCPPPSPALPKPALPPVAPAPAEPTSVPLPPIPPAARETPPPPKLAATGDGLPDLAPAKTAVVSEPPPVPQTPPPPVTTDLKKPAPAPPPAVAIDHKDVSPVAPPSEGQDIKQLLTRLSEIKSERTKLDERERQTIQSIKKKYQEQKHALEQLGRELRQLGINCQDDAPSHSE
jgi:hypothetical protein